MFVLQSVSKSVTMRAIFNPLRTTMLGMPYVQAYMPYNKRKEGEIEFTENHIHITPVLASVQAMVGQAIAGCQLDEINFMQIVENSKQIAGPAGMGGRWGQAQEVYDTISRRRKGRFRTRGPSFGALTISSSTRYEGDFLDRRIAQVYELDEKNVLVRRHKQYDVQPRENSSGETFRLLVGTDTHPTRILDEDEEAGVDFDEDAQVENVPMDYLSEFQRDPENALRDIIGVATKAITPFITQRHKVVDAILEGRRLGMKPLVYKQDVDLLTEGMPQINEANLPTDLDTPRAVHVDLSKTGDRCGIAMSKLLGFVSVLKTNEHTGAEFVQRLPKFAVELTVSIKPHPMRPISIPDVRTWIVALGEFYGLNIAHVSYDGFQSDESIDLLNRAGISASKISVDTSLEPYEYLRDGIYEDRIAIVDDPNSDLLRMELISLEYRQTRTHVKVDHAPRGSKDVSDAVAGSIKVLSDMNMIARHVETVDTAGERVNVSRQPKTARARPEAMMGSLIGGRRRQNRSDAPL